jgi:hypothetical protein
MQFAAVITADKIASKHHMTVREARQVLLSKPRIRFAEKGHIANNDVYAAFGQTFNGRLPWCFLCTNPTRPLPLLSVPVT